MDVTLSQVRELIDTVLRVRFSDLELERICCEKLLQFADEQKSTYAKAFAYTYLGDYYLAMNDSMNSGKYLATARRLCDAKTYPELYMRVCHLSGFYYHVINDEQNALQYYIEAQAIAGDLGDTYEVCNAWNNIADMFERHENYEQANHYYSLAHQTMIKRNCHSPRLAIMLEYNLAINNWYLGNLSEMQRYLTLCEQVKPGDEGGEIAFHRICCQSGKCLLEAYKGNSAKAVEIADDILDNNFYGVQDQYAIMEFLTPVAQSMVNLNNSESAKKYIDMLSDHCTANEILPMRHLIDLKTRYAQAFSQGEELLQSYRDYYFTMQKILKAEDGVRAHGMNSKINLLEMIKQHKTTLKENERLTDAANLDELTGIYNRRYFNQCIQEELAAESNVGIIMLDIDYFKQFNDTYGHVIGDFALREVAVALKKYATKNIVPCRYGGDEFSCICIDTSDSTIEEFIVQVESHIKELAIPHEGSKCSKFVTLSIGYSNMTEGIYGDAEITIKQADKALYSAKENGRNCWVKYTVKRVGDGLQM